MSPRRILIVDGYNVIRSTPPYRDAAKVDLDAARAVLISDVAAYAQGEWAATIVFDGGGNEGSDGRPHEVAGITVIFSKYGADADSVIESLSRKARERGDDVDVVTSDAQLQWAVFGGTVIRRSAAEFAAELRTGEAEWREHAPAGSSKSRIEDRLDAQTRDALARWARGEQ